MRSKTLIKIAVSIVFSVTFSFAQQNSSNPSIDLANKPVGVGGYLQIGNAHEHFGLIAKFKLNPTTSFDLSGSIELDNDGSSIGVYGGYYYHYYNVIKPDAGAGRVPLYHGPYGGIGLWDSDGGNDGFALRIGWTGGIAYELPRSAAPMDFFFDLNPVFEYLAIENVEDEWEFPEIYAKLGFRFYF